MTFSFAPLTRLRISLGLSPRSLTAAAVCLLAWTAPTRADLITFSGDTANSTAQKGDFSASLSYSASNSTSATLTIALTNTTPSAGGYLTGFVLNNPGGITSVSESSVFGNGNFQLLGLSNAGVKAMPLGYFDFGAALGGNWEGGGKPQGGILAGSAETFTFDLTGTNLDSLTATSFANALNSDGYYFAARFKGMSGKGKSSDKVPAGADAGGGHTSSTTPEPTSLLLWAVFGLGLLAYAALNWRQTRPAMQ